MARVHAVLLNEGAMNELNHLMLAFVRVDRDSNKAYFYAETIDQDGYFIRMRIKHKMPDDSIIETDVSIPIRHVNCIVAAADVKKLGFV